MICKVSMPFFKKKIKFITRVQDIPMARQINAVELQRNEILYRIFICSQTPLV